MLCINIVNEFRDATCLNVAESLLLRSQDIDPMAACYIHKIYD